MRHTHTEIGIIVSAESEEAARVRARIVVDDRLCAGENSYYDYGHVVGDEKDDSTEEPSAMRVDSDAGKKWLADTTKQARELFDRSLNRLRAMLAIHSNDVLWAGESLPSADDSNPAAFRYVAGKVSGEPCYDTLIFDANGRALHGGEDLRTALEPEAEPLWIVLADVHS